MVDDDILVSLVDLYKILREARNKNEGYSLKPQEVILMHDHLKAFFGSLTSG